MVKYGLIVLGTVILCLCTYGGIAWYVSSPDEFLPTADDCKSLGIHRLAKNPIIHHRMDAVLIKEAGQFGYVNINGPALIAVPSWVKKPLGKYYLYFAHHKGDSIRLAYAENLEGPWKIHPSGALQLEASLFTMKQPELSPLGRLRVNK